MTHREKQFAIDSHSSIMCSTMNVLTDYSSYVETLTSVMTSVMTSGMTSVMTPVICYGLRHIFLYFMKQKERKKNI